MSSRHRHNIILHGTDYQTIVSAKIYLHDSVGGGRHVNLKELLLIPKTIREVERCLLLFEAGVLCLMSGPLLGRRRISMRHFAC